MNPNAKSIGIVATSSLPWLTGTSIIPLFHSVYLNKRGIATTLYLPWLSRRQQQLCFQQKSFQSQEEQRTYIVRWLPEELREFLPHICFYPAWYSRQLKSIFPLRSIRHVVRRYDVIILEEPQHLFFLHPFSRFKKYHPSIIGIIMTNSEYFVRQRFPASFTKLMQRYFRGVMQRMCHKLIAISATQRDIYTLPECEVIPLNAVNPQFFRTPRASQEIFWYFIGKLIPEKGLEDLFQGLQAVGIDSIDLFGYGNTTWVQRTALKYGVHPVFKGITLTPWKDLSRYKMFINCSRSEYLCSTTAEALAMQKWVIVPKHESNQFFYQFRNCLSYSTRDEFPALLEYARLHEPEYDPKVSELSWDAATDRLLDIIRNR